MRALALVLAVALGGLLTWQFMPQFQARAPVGDTIKLTVQREGRSTEPSATLKAGS